MIFTTSWDDGHILDKKLAALLARYGLKATFYISPENRELPSQKRLSREDVKALASQFEIGAHTLTHPSLPLLNEASAEHEIVGSKRTLEEWTDREVKAFAYPRGKFTRAIADLVRRAGFSLARTTSRFSLETGPDVFVMPTTVHAYRHWSDAAPIARNSTAKNFLKNYLNWDDLAIALFEKARAENGVFHLWGHSWEIEKNGDWDRLERVFKHVAGQPNMQIITNSELIAAR